MILHEKTKEEFGYSWEEAGVWKNFHCKCDYCGKEFLRSKRNIKSGRNIIHKESCSEKVCNRLKREESSLVKHGVKNAGGIKESLDKSKKTNLSKYGVENAAQFEDFKEKAKKTCRKKYGKDSYLSTDECKKIREEILVDKYGIKNPGAIEEFKEKARKTCREKYGVDHHSQLEESRERMREKSEEFVKLGKAKMLEKYGKEYAFQVPELFDKFKETCKDRYGFEVPMKNRSVRDKAKNTCKERYGVEYPLQKLEFFDKFVETCLEKYGCSSYLGSEKCQEETKKLMLERYGVDNYSKTKEFIEKYKQVMLEKYGVEHYSKTQEFKESYLNTCLSKYGVSCTLLLNNNYGKAQKEIQDWLNSFGFNFQSDYSILEGKEIDLYDEELRLGIEYCGLYWHNELSPEPRMKSYHYDKYRLSKDKQVRLITIFEDEWMHHENQCKNFIKSILNINDQTIFARKCSIKEITKSNFSEFCNENHIIGANKLGLIFYGLFYEDNLVAAMSLGKHHRNREELVLDRLCFKDGIQVIGGASKLFKKCVNWAKDKGFDRIISWSDNRWSQGNVYEKMGFVLDREYGPDYSYVNINGKLRRFSKQSKKKRATNCPDNLTEKEWMLENGFARIWDCGKKRWLFVID